SYVADLATRGASGEQRLLALYAVIRGWMNVGVLAIQVFGTSALFRQIGVPLAAAVSPVIYLLGLAGLSLRTSLPAGVGAMAGTIRTAGTPTSLAARLDASSLGGLSRMPECPDLARRRAACALVVEGPRSRAVPRLARALGVARPANRRLLITALDRILE